MTLFNKKKHKQSKSEVLKSIEKQQEVNRQRSKVKDELYPLLLENSKNIDDAKMMCQVTTIAIRQAFQNRATKMKLGDLGLPDMLAEGNDRVDIYKKILEMFADENLTVAISIIDGFSEEINKSMIEESRQRQLSDLKLTLLEPYEIPKN